MRADGGGRAADGPDAQAAGSASFSAEALAGRLVRATLRGGQAGLLPMLDPGPDRGRDPVPMRPVKDGWAHRLFLPADTRSVAVVDARDGRSVPAAGPALRPVGWPGMMLAALVQDPAMALTAVADGLRGRRRAARAKALAALLDPPTSPAVHARWADAGGRSGSGSPEAADVADLVLDKGVGHDDLMAALRAGETTAVLLRTADARVAAGAVEHLRRRLAADDRLSGAYGDVVVLDGAGRVAAVRALPAWSPTLARAGGLPVSIALVRRDRLLVALDHRRLDPGGADPVTRCLLALSDGVDGRIAHDPVLTGQASACPPPVRSGGAVQAGSRTVAALIPTRDQPGLLDRCLKSLLRETDHPPAEVVVGDNDSCEPATFRVFARWLDGATARRIAAPGPFNYAALCNRLAGESRSELLLFLNDDVEALHPDWLDRMVAVLDDPAVGAVGARLLYPDGSLQHLGIVLGLGPVAGHAFQFLRPAAVARSAAPHADLPREVSAVTGACLLVRRSVFEAVGGFDAARLPVAYNDVDLCLRIWEAGHRVVCTPDATLVHHESVSRRRLPSPERAAAHRAEVAHMQARWGHLIGADPFYSPRLSRLSRAVRLAPFCTDPRLRRPPVRLEPPC
ncbi:glycosyltransferase family 2 protein [Mongoliimonas terrestris]|uniref:glycosyltransferase family 2 protein n=1 Tax=Mongoliimonas terrestris TaxID=1709001 RepID=UPI000B073372|nr:glycosyltransferase family 2 protein [Mongoliimonas terrestris]